MGDQIEALAGSLLDFAQSEKQPIDLVISHYWDAASVANMFLEKMPEPIPHIWVPHSLGRIKKRNVSEDQWGSLRIEERIEEEQRLLARIKIVASTSALISKSLQDDYDFKGKILWLPPCVSPARFHPREMNGKEKVWELISRASSLPAQEVRNRIIITEISRTDTTKRKDILIRAFANVYKQIPEILLVITIDQRQEPLSTQLHTLIDSLGVRGNVAVLGSVWESLPEIYAASDIYCTPSIMEGFGMSAQEAASTAVPVIASSLVPFAAQYLFGETGELLTLTRGQRLSVGKGAILVQPDSVEGFAEAMTKLILDETLREKMGSIAYQITIPRFTWPRVVKRFLDNLTTGR